VRRSGALVGAAVILALGLPAAPAAAHPLGLPAFAQVTASDTSVTVLWNASPDDVAALARALGLTTARELTREEDAELAGSDQLRRRVLEDVAVTQGDATCVPEHPALRSVVEDGLRLVFRCPERIDRVRVRLELLHDIDSRYRTLAVATGPDGKTRVMFSDAEPAHDLRLDPGGAAPVAQTRQRTEVRGFFGGALPFERRFVAAVDSPPGLLGGLLALLAAFAVGALHALAPGHGKAVAAGYLIGERGRVRHAVALGMTVALMHTGSVLALGLALYSAARAPDAARLSDTIALVSGVVFASLGLWLLARRWRSRGHTHDVVEPDHAHGAAEPSHSHEPAGIQSLQGVVALGAAGGLLPSPSALLVLLTALAVGRVAYGLTLIVAFSLGLATTVTLVGVAVLRGRDLLHDRAGARLHRLVHAAPLLGALSVTVVGLAIAVRAGTRLV
jgi:ABC-type nickel/cobalt efflux system permease component RcnA